jgi:acyl dehydratase
MLYWEDFHVGRIAEFGPQVIAREAMIGFAAEFDSQPFFLDEKAGHESMLGGLSASGWYVCAVVMRMVAAGLAEAASMGSPGVEEVKWLKPVRAGDRLSVRWTVLERRPSSSRPEMGFAKMLTEVFNQHREPVMTQVTTIMLGRRESNSEPA